jgi:hypothetical protein
MADGRHVGAGVMNRMHQFLDQDLAPRVAQVARTTAARFFRESYDAALEQVTGGLQRFNNPLEYASTLLLGGHERAQDALPQAQELVRVRDLLGKMSAFRAEVDA